MKSPERCVFDANVLVSALLFEQSKPARALRMAHERGEVLLSLPLLAELNGVLSRPKFVRYVTRHERERFLGALVREARLVEITAEVRVAPDRRDDLFLELAVSGNAACIITGDQHLLHLDSFRGITILSPEAFLRRRG